MSQEPELFDTSRVRDDATHWDALAARITAHVVHDDGAGAAWFVRGPAGLVAASLALAAAVVFAVLSAGGPPAPNAGAELAIALGPSDPVGQSIVLRDGPPTIGDLLFDRPDAP